MLSFLKERYSGRIGRVNFLAGTLLFQALIFVLFFLGAIIFILLSHLFSIRLNRGAILIIEYILTVILFVGGQILYIFPLWVRRLHDIGKSGWYFIGYLALIPLGMLLNSIAGNCQNCSKAILLFILACFIIYIVLVVIYIVLFFIKKGQDGENIYGPRPLKESNFYKEVLNKK